MKLTNAQKVGSALILALIVAAVVYPVLRPTKQDSCASEILINARGGTVDLRTRTISVGAKSQPVALEKMTNDTQLVIDELARLCRQHAEGRITTEQYFTAIQNRLRPTEKPAAPPAAKVPRFDGSIGVTGLVDNRPFRKFADDNAGKIVRLRLRIDAGAYNPVGVFFLEKCYESVADNGERTSVFPDTMDNLFGQRFSLVEAEQDVQEYDISEAQKLIGCGPAVEFISSNRTLHWSSDGPGLTHATIDGFYRENIDQMGAGITYRFEEVAGSIADYAEVQD
jgi:hypothetical protein